MKNPIANRSAMPQKPPEVLNASKNTFISPRSASRPLTVLLSGYRSHIGQHLYTHLARVGFSVIPVSRTQNDIQHRTQLLTIGMLKDKGLPDVDFVVNVSGVNLYRGKWDGILKTQIEESHIEMNHFFADLIRRSDCKPYAFITGSSTNYYPPSNITTYDESFSMPAKPLSFQKDRPELQAQELSLPYFSRLYRDSESAARIFRPEYDSKTPEQEREYEAQLALIRRSHENRIYTDENHDLQHQLDQSERKALLKNKDVRVINMRYGHLLSQNMQQYSDYARELEWGFLSHIGSGTHEVPWIHVDDAMRMTIFSMMDSEVNGAVNAVAPNPATNKDITRFVARSKNVFTHPFGISDQWIEKQFGSVRAPLFTKATKVVPKVALERGFDWKYPTIDDAIASGRLSELDREILDAGGFDKIYRNSNRPILR